MATTSRTGPGKGFLDLAHKKMPLPDDVNYGTFVVFPEQGGDTMVAPGQNGIRTATAQAPLPALDSDFPDLHDLPGVTVESNPVVSVTGTRGGEPPEPKPKPDPVPDNSGIAIDPSSGISEEEQQQILVQINGIADKHRRSLAGTGSGKGSWQRFKAKKNGGLFPILVNVIAMATLALGLFVLYWFQAETYELARQGTRVFSRTERALIDAIRMETETLLETTDGEILRLLALLADVNMRLDELITLGILTPEQVVIQNRLNVERNEYLVALGMARQERVEILDGARSQEIMLQEQVEVRVREEAIQAQLEGRLREMTLQDHIATRFRETVLQAPAIRDEPPRVVPEDPVMEAVPVPDVQVRDVPDPAREAERRDLIGAREELARLAAEQAQVSRMENQVIASISTIHKQMAESRFTEAELAIGSLRDFLAAPAFHGLRAVQARMEHYVHAADTLETLLETLREVDRIASAAIHAGVPQPVDPPAPADPTADPVPLAADPGVEAELRQEIARLEEALAAGAIPVDVPHLDPVADPVADPDIGAELRQEIARLEAQLAAREYAQGISTEYAAQLAARMHDTVGNLQSVSAALDSQVGALQSANSALGAQVGTLQSANSILASQLDTLQSTNATLTLQLNVLQNTNTTLNSHLDAMQTTNSTLNTHLGAMQSVNAMLNDIMSDTQTTNSLLNTQLNTLQTSNHTLNTQVGSLQTSLDAQTRLSENLRQDTERQQQELQSLRTTNVSLNNQLVRLRQALLDQ